VLVAAAGDARSWAWAGTPLLDDGAVAGAAALGEVAGGGRPIAALLAGGETTVTLRPHAGAPPPGRGGRNQELALAALIAAAEAEAGSPRAAAPPYTAGDLAIICFATDGSDGPTDAAGVAIPSARAHWRARAAAGIDAADALRRHDAYSYFAAMDGPLGPGEEERGVRIAPGGLIFTGPTGTNVGDIACLLHFE